MKHTVFCVILFLVSHVLQAQEKITLLFAGDLMQHQGQIDAARTEDGYDYSDCFQYVKEEISRADIAIGNLEVTLGGPPYKGYPAFSAPDEYLSAIKDAGFDILLTANNHCLDRGKPGLERTIACLDSLGIPYLGTYINKEERMANYPLSIRKNGFHLVLLNYTYGTNGIKVHAPNIVNYIDKEVMAEDIRIARSRRPDAIIACMHWGVEYQSLPGKEQKDLVDWLLQQGVTHVIGGHPHVLQPMELRRKPYSPDKNVVVYSLGNFISNMSAPQTDGGAMFKLELTKRNHIVTVSNCGYSLVWTSRPVLSKKKNYVLYPAGGIKPELTAAEKERLNRFLTGSRKLLDKYNQGVEEYVY